MAFRDEWGQLHLDPAMVEYLMKDYHFNDPQDAFYLAARNAWAFSSALWRLPPGIWEPWDLQGQVLNFEGHRLKCVGSEAFANMRSPESPYTHPLCVAFAIEDLEAVGYDYRRFDRTQK